MKTKFNEFAKLEPSVEKTLTKIDNFPDNISIRKSRNYINNILINSKLCKFYKDYYNFKDVKVKKLPIPNIINDYEEIFLRIDLELNRNKDFGYNNMLHYLKEYLVYISYFPYILEYRDNQLKKVFGLKFIPYLLDLIDKDDIHNEVLEHQGYINHHLTVSDSFEEIRVIEQFV